MKSRLPSGTPFERSARLAVHAVVARHGYLGRARSSLDVAGFRRPFEIEIVTPVLIDEDGIAVHTPDGVDDCVEHVVIDHY